MGKGPKPESLEHKLYRFVDRRGVDDCWPWIGPTRPNGYGCVADNKTKKTQAAHRVMYREFKGEIPDGMVVMHACDNRICVNPNHLSVGTNRDNQQDSIHKGRAFFCRTKRDQSTQAVLTEMSVHRIRMMKNVLHVDRVAELFGVTRSNIYKILQGRSWTEFRPDPKWIFGL